MHSFESNNAMAASDLTERDIALAVTTLRAGKIVGIPTETVYGLAADAENNAAVRRVFEVKGRPLGHAVIVHLPDADHLERWACEIRPCARVLSKRFWPGPLTMVMRRTTLASNLVTGGQTTVAIRVSSHPIMQRVLARFGRAVIAPSANRFGHVSATSACHVRKDLGDAVDVILDGGPSKIGIESTIVDVSQDEPAILRPGAIAREALEATLGREIVERCGRNMRVPGSLASHYAPRAQLELTDKAAAQERCAALRAAGRRVAFLSEVAEPIESLAHSLYARLRAADDEGIEVIVVALPDPVGIGRAVRDRLQRAAALKSS